MDAIRWLLDGDPAIRWQTMRDLLDADEATVDRERAKVGRHGWGARLLAKQDPDGRWAKGLSSDDGMYLPKWISTHYTMLELRDLGLPPTRATDRTCRLLLDKGLQKDNGLAYETWGRGRGETCVTGMGLSILAHFEHDDARLDTIARHLLDEQMDDGGWNCRRPRGATHASVHTTISALEGLRAYERRRRNLKVVRAAQKRGREFLLAHRMYRSHRTGAIIKRDLLRFAFPPRWHYDVLRGLDYFQSVDAPRDERLTDAIAVLEEHRRDGLWPLEYAYRGKTWFQMEPVGAPSRWNTLRALRVLRWWQRR